MSRTTATPSVEPVTPAWQTPFRNWAGFWFSPGDPTLLGVVRVCVGLVVLYILYSYSFDLQEILGPDAWIDRPAMEQMMRESPRVARAPDWSTELNPVYHPPQTEDQKRYMLIWGPYSHPDYLHTRGFYVWSIWFHVADPFWMKVVHGAVLAVVFLFTVGCCTRVTSALTWLLALGYTQRSPTTLFGVDTMTNFALLYLMIGPSGAALSVDRLVRRYRLTRAALKARAARKPADDRAGPVAVPVPPPAPAVSANLALRLLQVHVCVVYLFAGLSKLQGKAWWDATAIWSTMANPEFSPVQNPLYMDLLVYLCQHRWLSESVMAFGAFSTIAFEVCFPFLVWNPRLRWTMVVAAVLMHAGIAFFMGLTVFSLAMLSIVVAFIPPGAVHRLLRWLGRGSEDLGLAFAGRDRGQLRAAALVHAFDPWGQVALADQAPRGGPGSPAPLQLTTAAGEVLTGYPLFERLARSLRLLWPLAALTWVPGVSAFGRTWFPASGALSSPDLAVAGGPHQEQGETVGR